MKLLLILVAAAVCVFSQEKTTDVGFESKYRSHFSKFLKKRTQIPPPPVEETKEEKVEKKEEKGEEKEEKEGQEVKKQKSWEDTELRAFLMEQGRRYTPLYSAFASDLEEYERCLSNVSHGAEIQRDLLVVYRGQPELKLACEPFCKRPDGPPWPDWYFFNKYISNTSLSLANATRAEEMQNAVLYFGKTTLVLKDLSAEHAGKYYCKYEDTVIREYWVYTVEHSNINYSLVESNEIPIPNATTRYADWGITVLYKVQSGSCNLQTYEETLIDDSNILDARWWTHKVFYGKWWERGYGNFKSFLTQNQVYAHLTLPRQAIQVFPYMSIDSEPSPNISANYSEVSTLQMFSGMEVPFVPDLMPSAFPAKLFHHTYIFEKNCSKGSLIQREYEEKEFYVREKKTFTFSAFKISCSGGRDFDNLTWSKEGVTLRTSTNLSVTKSGVTFHKAFTNDSGKYTCWKGDMALASTNVLVENPLKSKSMELTFKWILSILIFLCLIMFFYNVLCVVELYISSFMQVITLGNFRRE
ncbi:uncharacterized protein LOC135201766 [Macrobrachium nipponense]|uniref:uncharacterized protein LOC135201766 n=1 Tax=Macrobrachium nipponense TaxID=159736 RepID=UPI0030C7AFCF